MAYANFKQTFWSKHIQHELEKRAILSDWCNKEFTGEAKYGNKVKILGVGRPSIGNYAGTTIGDPEDVADSSVFLDIDKAKYFNFGVDDVDKAQSTPGLMEALMEEATIAMSLEIDSDVAECGALGAGAFSNSLQINSAATAKTAVDADIHYMFMPAAILLCEEIANACSQDDAQAQHDAVSPDGEITNVE